MTPRSVLIFALRFTAAILVIAPLWWLAMPAYGWALLQLCGAFLKWILGVSIEAGRVEPSGVLNTGTALVYQIGGVESRLALARLVTNLAPFLALIIATPGRPLRWRTTAALGGGGLLVVLHGAYIILALRLRDTIAIHPEAATALSQFMLTLPFLLWAAAAAPWRFGAKDDSNHADQIK